MIILFSFARKEIYSMTTLTNEQKRITNRKKKDNVILKHVGEATDWVWYR